MTDHQFTPPLPALLLGTRITMGGHHFIVTRTRPSCRLDGNRKQRRAKEAKLRKDGEV